MAFPTSPSNGDRWQENGVTYQYSSSSIAWLKTQGCMESVVSGAVIKGTTTDGTTNILECRNSSDSNMITIKTNGATSINGDTTIGGETNMEGSLSIEGNLSVEMNVDIDGDTTIDGLLKDGNGLTYVPYHPKTAIPYWGTYASLERGWQLCNGTNSTPDLRGQFIRGAGSDSEVGDEVDYTTAKPRTKFYTNTDSHTHTVVVNPFFSDINNTNHTHTHDHGSQTITTSSDSASESVAYLPILADETPSLINYETDSVGTKRGISLTSSGIVATSALFHDHSVSIDISSKTSDNQSANHKHYITVPSTETTADSHSHYITSGGDSETAPDHILMYWIAYTGSLASNW